ncbi:MAG: hypothetical protein KY475_10115 [Planctomycetes bacterium]|nr:hypothetical protein [Planctomycetota bacterium]
MKIQQLLEHHGIARNPFAEEDAQTDPVFKDYCIDNSYHPTWDKIFGDPAEPATAIVFGEKGAGKTAMRLQIARRLEEYNAAHPDGRLYVIHYDDFNHYLDTFRDKVGPRRRPEKLLSEWKLWDHMDAVLALGVTGLIDRVLEVSQPSVSAGSPVDRRMVSKLEHHQARDLLLLAAYYDQSMAETFRARWRRLRKRLHYRTWLAHWDLALGVVWTMAAVAAVIWIFATMPGESFSPLLLYLLLALAFVLAGWAPWTWRFLRRHWLARKIARRVRTGNRQAHVLRRVLMNFAAADLADQPFPAKDRTDDRYELLMKFQSILQTLGFKGIVVLVDRVDEPHLINGSPKLMRALVWPMLDNKFLKHPGLGLKLMLPIELTQFLEREDAEFYQRARLDKQNTVRSLEWTGQALYDVTNARIKACAADGAAPTLRDLFAPGLSDERLIEALRSLRVPRAAFKCLYRMLVTHCNAHTDMNPAWQISPETFESVLAVYHREQEAFDRGLGAG